MIVLSSKRGHLSELDKRKLAKTIGIIIPILIKSNRVVSSMGESIQLESRLILR